jgi:hypothetical protein
MFSFVVCLGMLHYSLWEMPVLGRIVTRNLKEKYLWFILFTCKCVACACNFFFLISLGLIYSLEEEMHEAVGDLQSTVSVP